MPIGDAPLGFKFVEKVNFPAVYGLAQRLRRELLQMQENLALAQQMVKWDAAGKTVLGSDGTDPIPDAKLLIKHSTPECYKLDKRARFYTYVSNLGRVWSGKNLRKAQKALDELNDARLDQIERMQESAAAGEEICYNTPDGPKLGEGAFMDMCAALMKYQETDKAIMEALKRHGEAQAAVVIQAAFRGHRVRSLLRGALDDEVLRRNEGLDRTTRVHPRSGAPAPSCRLTR